MLLALLLAGSATAEQPMTESGDNTGNSSRTMNRDFVGDGAFDQVPFGAESINDTSEYALGSYTHNIVFVQDDQVRNLDISEHPKASETECETLNCGVVHWTESMLEVRKQRVEEAISFWNEESIGRHHPAAQLEITVNFTNDVYNNADPFTVDDIGNESSSIGFIDALSQINSDYGDNTSFSTATRQFNDDTRRANNTHWAFTSFIKPYEGRASASLNGPYHKGYEDDPSWTYAHELGHIFGARDEYGSHETDERSGYLYSYNTNAAYLPGGEEQNPDSVTALMKSHGSYFISEGANGAIGWQDTDADTIPDILDTVPTLAMDISGSEESASLFQALIDATVTPLPSPDPYEDDFTINTLASAQYRVDRELWTDLLPLDGAFGDYLEQFQVERLFTSPGSHRIDFRVFNSVGNHAEHRFMFTAVPEPSTLAMGIAILLGSVRRRERRAVATGE